MRMFVALSLFSLSFVCVFVTPAMADGPLPWEGSGSGDWNGQRKHLDDEIGLTFWWLQDLVAQQVVSGGIRKGGAAESRSMLEVNYQFEPLTPLKGSEIQVSAAWNVGTNIQDSVGSLLPPNATWQESAIRLYELYWGQSFADEQVHFKIGRLGLCPFEAAYTMLTFGGDLSAGYFCNPGALYLNQPVAAAVYPIATWGARIKIAPKKQDFEFWFGAYNGSQSDTLADGDQRGVDFGFNLKESTYVQGEFAYKLNQDPGDVGLPGNYKIGGVYDSGSFTEFGSGETERGNPGWYVLFDQMLFRERPPATPTDPAKSKGGFKMRSPSHQGLYATANFVHHPKTEISIAPYWVSAALFYRGAIPHRDADQMSLGFYYASLSPDSILDFEFQLRFYYTLQLTKWFFMSPNVQYFKQPGGGRVPNAVLLGTYFHFTL